MLKLLNFVTMKTKKILIASSSQKLWNTDSVTIRLESDAFSVVEARLIVEAVFKMRRCSKHRLSSKAPVAPALEFETAYVPIQNKWEMFFILP